MVLGLTLLLKIRDRALDGTWGLGAVTRLTRATADSFAVQLSIWSYWLEVSSGLARAEARLHCHRSMAFKSQPLFRIGTIVLALCAILSAQMVTIPKLPPPRMRKPPSCNNCVRDVNGQISHNPAPVREFRATHPCPADGSLKGPCPGYLVDFKKPLARGGKDDPRNMRWKSIAQALKEHR